jgi:hypothetical protein
MCGSPCRGRPFVPIRPNGHAESHAWSGVPQPSPGRGRVHRTTRTAFSPGGRPGNLVAVGRARYGRRAMRRSFWALLLLAGLAAGCNSEPSTYKAMPTAKCLRNKLHYQVTTEPAQLGIVERNAPNGGLLAHYPGNAFRAAFAESSDAASGFENGFKRFAQPKLRPHITDVMRTNKNAVLLWTVTPSQEVIDSVYGCLKG